METLRNPIIVHRIPSERVARIGAAYSKGELGVFEQAKKNVLVQAFASSREAPVVHSASIIQGMKKSEIEAYSNRVKENSRSGVDDILIKSTPFLTSALSALSGYPVGLVAATIPIAEKLIQRPKPMALSPMQNANIRSVAALGHLNALPGSVSSVRILGSRENTLARVGIAGYLRQRR
ncbi:MAG: hypothetical protein WC408_04140 [Candidatus Micrarchaeia archaeon]